MCYTREEENLIILCSFNGLTYKTRYKLLDGLEKAEPDFVKYRDALIKNYGDGVYNKVEAHFNDAEYRKKIISSLGEKGVKCVTYFSKEYPALLKQTDYPPLVLYCKGNLRLLNTRCFSIVGSRRTPNAVIAECKKTAGELAKHFTVVSGMADGGDSAAIEGALPSGNVISVLAYGFDYFYPAVNEQLIKKVEKSGLLVTEFTPDTSPKAYLFPIRNRIIAGLSEGTLVVSAGKKSGALITAEYAVEYSRHLFAFPYGIGAAAGAGCNGLIKNGAFLVDSTEDIFGIFGIDYNAKDSVCLTDSEREVYELIGVSGEAFVGDIASKLNKMPYQLLPVLSSLEIKGKIVRLGGNRFSAL